MTEYIDLDKKIMVVDTQGRKLETTVRHILDFNNGEYEADDAKLARHGRWVREQPHTRHGLGYWNCSECNQIELLQTPFCPNCGASMMDGGDTNGI